MTAVLLIPFWMTCVAVYRSELDEDGQVEFKGNAKAFVRAYNFLVSGASLRACGVGDSFPFF